METKYASKRLFVDSMLCMQEKKIKDLIYDRLLYFLSVRRLGL